jgi:ABC-type multidrug transport system fused ATPase/permease subunit
MFKELYYDFINNNKKLILLYLIAIALTFPLKNFGMSKLYGKLFASIKKNNLSNGFYLNFTSVTSFPNIIFLLLFTWFIIIIANFIKKYLQSFIYPKLTAHIRKELFSKTLNKYEKNYKNLMVGKEIGMMVEFANQSKNVADIFSKYWIPLFISLVVIKSYMLINYPKLFIPIFLGSVTSIVLIYYFSENCIELARQKYISFLHTNEKINDSYSNLMNIYINNQKNQEIDNYSNIEDKKMFKENKFLVRTAKLVLYISIISLITFLTTFYISYKMYMKSEIIKEEFISIILIIFSYIGFLLDSTNILPKLLNKMGIIRAEGENLESLFKGKNNKIKNNYKINNGSIEFRNVTFKYPNEKKNKNKNIIDRINFKIEANEKVALIGCSGCGKTTIIKLILNMYKINSGKIVIDNVDIRDYNVKYLREQVNYINQKTILFDENVIENIRKGNAVNDQQIISILKFYKLDIVYQNLKKGVYSNAGVHGNNLSVGMQKVTIIMRGMLKQGKILILDEPLAGLDINTRKKITRLIKDVSKNKTLIIISHNKELLPLVDRVIDIKDI